MGDRLRHLHALQAALMATGVQLNAWVLMDNHVHLLATPAATGDIGRFMQRLGRQPVCLFNARHRRTGTLREGRYKACPVDIERYVLTSQHDVELDPVRARITDDAAAWRRSSCAAHLGQRNGSMRMPHPAWLALDADPLRRARRWRDKRDEAAPDEDLTSILEYLQPQRAWGRNDVRARVDARTGRSSGVRPAHRPSRADR